MFYRVVVHQCGLPIPIRDASFPNPPLWCTALLQSQRFLRPRFPLNFVWWIGHGARHHGGIVSARVDKASPTDPRSSIPQIRSISTMWSLLIVLATLAAPTAAFPSGSTRVTAVTGLFIKEMDITVQRGHEQYVPQRPLFSIPFRMLLGSSLLPPALARQSLHEWANVFNTVSELPRVHPRVIRQAVPSRGSRGHSVGTHERVPLNSVDVIVAVESGGAVDQIVSEL